ncbi:mitochondrial fission ELM1 family protein [Segnochrobactraceae bacterium EtOH-i3]
MEPKSALVIVPEGKAGHETQSVAVAEALGCVPRIVRVRLTPPWSWIAPLGPGHLEGPLAPPWPPLVIASGRQAIPAARALARHKAPRPFVVILHDPRVRPSAFDLVWVNDHDFLRRPALEQASNVIHTPTAPLRATRARMTEGAAQLLPRVSHLPGPRIGVLVGGPSGAYGFSAGEAAELGRRLAEAATRSGGSLLITPSRRTPPEAQAALRAAISGVPGFFWDGSGDNPYFGILGLADHLVVTCDSVAMLSEAAATGRPVHAFPLAGGTRKFALFHEALIRAGVMDWFDGTLTERSYSPIDATEMIAAEIRTRLGDQMPATSRQSA